MAYCGFFSLLCPLSLLRWVKTSRRPSDPDPPLLPSPSLTGPDAAVTFLSPGGCTPSERVAQLVGRGGRLSVSARRTMFQIFLRSGRVAAFRGQVHDLAKSRTVDPLELRWVSDDWTTSLTINSRSSCFHLLLCHNNCSAAVTCFLFIALLIFDIVL